MLPVIHRQRGLRGLEMVVEHLKVISGYGCYFSSLLSETRIVKRADHLHGDIFFSIHGIFKFR